MRYVLERNSGIIPCAIKWQQRSDRSHAQLVFSDGVMIEATYPKVRKHPWNFEEYRTLQKAFDLYEVDTTLEQEAIMREFAEKQIGKRYDLTMVLRFVTRQQETRKSTGMWFCSELVFAAFLKVDIRLLNHMEPCYCSPGHLELPTIARLVLSVGST